MVHVLKKVYEGVLLTELAPICHDEVAAIRDDRIHSRVLQHLRDEVPLPLQINSDRFEVTFG